MSFEPQNVGHCGLAALQYALSLVGYGWADGQRRNVKAMRRLLRRTRTQLYDSGADEHRLAAGARRAGVEPIFHPYATVNVDRVIADLRAATERGHPCLVTWHNDDENHFHWVCVGGFTRDGERVVLYDPNFTDDDRSRRTYRPVDRRQRQVPAYMSLERFREWLNPEQPLDDEEAHFFIEIAPGTADQPFLVGLGDETLLEGFEAHPSLMRNFDEIMDDLRVIFTVSDESVGPSAYAFLDAHQEVLGDTCQQWTFLGRKYRQREVELLLAVTRAYPALKVPLGQEAQTLLQLGFYLGWRAACCAYEVET